MYDWENEPEDLRNKYYTSGITISNKHDFEIDGQGHFISGNPNNAGGDAKYGANLLTVSSSCSNITLKNIVFKDVRYGGSEALTFSCGNVTLKNCTFENIAIEYKVATKTKKYTVTLKAIKGSSIDGKTYFAAGKKVTLKVNGKTYAAKTNAKGQATFKIINLNKKGKYVVVIKYAGSNTYKAVSKNVKITVK